MKLFGGRLVRGLLLSGALSCVLLPAAARGLQNAAQGDAARSVGLGRLLAHGDGPPLDLKVVGSERRDGVTVDDLTFRGVTAGGAPVQGYLVRPSEGAGPFAAVLFVHWFAPPEPTSNRTQFLEEARALARRGTVSLLVSTFWSDPARYRARRWQDDYQNTINQAKELRRALDVLTTRPGVDARRVAYVGHDYGAMFGALLSGADARPRAYALIAGAPRFPDWYLYGTASGVPAGDDLEHFRKQFAPLDPVNAVAAAKASFFFQFGEDDRHTPRKGFVEFYLAAPAPKRIATYASDHSMSAEAIRRDRDAWLAEQLGIPTADGLPAAKAAPARAALDSRPLNF